MRAPPWSAAALWCALAGAAGAGVPAPDLPGQTLGSTCRALPALAAPAGWDEQAPLCAWDGRLQLRRWLARPEPPATGCVAPPARWWAWERARLAGARALPAWETQWTGNAAAGTDPLRLAVLELGEGAVWQAREWEWAPSPRRATRAWQLRRWQQLLRTVLEKRTAHQPHPPIDAPILQAWEAQLQGRAGERSNQSLRWQADGVCLRLIAELPPEPNFHLAYAREDARLEQRAAMQVQLARRYPAASWLVPFRLIDLPGADGARARYLAVWQDKGGITGQLWLPAADGARAVRVQVSGTLQAGQNGAATAATIEQELTALARRLGQPHER